MISDIKYKTFDFKRLSSGVDLDGVPATDNLGCAKNTYNFSYFDNKIKDGYGLSYYYVTQNNVTSALVFPANIVAKKMYSIYFKDETYSCLIVIGHNLKPYMWKYSDTTNQVVQLNFTLQGIPCVFGYVSNNAHMLGFSYNGKITTYNIEEGVVDFINNAYDVGEISFLDNCVIGIPNDDQYSFWYSESFSPSDWVKSLNKCTIQKVDLLLGKCLKIFKLEENLYLVREFGIQRLVWDIDSNKYQIQNVGESIGRIYSNSIGQYGSKIVYLTTNGLYEFNGNSSKKLKTNVEHILSGYENTSTACQNGKYFISSKYDFGDESIGIETSEDYSNNILLCIDLESKIETIFRGIDVVQLIPINTTFITDIGLIVYDGEKNQLSRLKSNCKIFNQNIKKHWESIPTDFGLPDKKKILSRFFIITKQDITITFYMDNKKYTTKIKGSEFVQTIRPNLSGQMFWYAIDSYVADNEIYSMKVLVGYES